MELRKKLKELENATSAVKGQLYDCLKQIDLALTKIEELMADA